MQPSVADNPRWWLWPTILCLDAPAVVVLWQVLLSRSASVTVGATEMGVLGSSVWLAYVADRWIEGWRLSPGEVQTHRHRFHQSRRWPVAVVWVGVFTLDVTVALGRLDAEELETGGLVLVPVAAYIFSHQLLHRKSRWRAPKEICVALLLGAGAAVFLVSNPAANLRALMAPLSLFVLLCFSNCALIAVWEDDVDRRHGQTSFAQQFRGSAAISRMLPWMVTAISVVTWAQSRSGRAAAPVCAAVSSILLGLVDRAEGRIGRVPARVLADVALLTPLIPLVLGSAR